MYDVIIVGARPAGSSTALLLARQGKRVLLVDRATFPSDAPRGHVIVSAGVTRLKAWGVLDKLLQTDTPAIRRINFNLGPFAFKGSPILIDGVDAAYAPRHEVIDQILFESAREAGAEVHDRFNVADLLLEDGRVVGIRGRDASGQTVEHRARLVIGADGKNSTVARRVDAPMYEQVPALSVLYFAYYRNFPVDGVELSIQENRLYGIYPTNDDLTCLFVQFPVAELNAFRQNLAENFPAIFTPIPSIVARLEKAELATPIMGSTDQFNFFRKPYGPGWALVGDAGYCKDPFTAQGFSDAFFSAEWLAEAIQEGWHDEQALQEALARYEARRNERFMPMYRYTCELASFTPPSPELLQLFSALNTNPEEANRFLNLINGVVAIPEFFAPENLQRILQAASA